MNAPIGFHDYAEFDDHAPIEFDNYAEGVR